ncbi:MAG: dicarboxylate/amino acid:cation symporter, partial [bacterium]|nr:dicarboxylate/amino acid:cation symporter [bacterium]
MATQQAGTDTKPKSRLSLSSLILIGIVAGIGCGLLLGEYCAWLKVLGDAFIGLLQMSVLPYIMVSLVVNIGRLSLGEGRRLAGRSGLILALLWVIAALAVVIAPFALPEFRAGSFFSTAILQSPPNVDFVGMYIPVNPFASLAESVVPAVVVFSIFFGVALIGIEKKQALLDQLDIILEALTRINTIIVRVTPVGVFAIVASIAGTLTLDELDRLRAYFIIYTASALILSFWLLPMLVAAVTPFSYRQVVSVSRDAVMTAFATGKLFVVLPMLIEASNRLF